jgi:hypothetical protein
MATSAHRPRWGRAREQRQKRRAPCTIPVYYRLLELSPEAGEKHIRRSPDMQASSMRRKGIAGRLIARDAAVRAANRHAVMRLR